jgi:hypothetical protein
MALSPASIVYWRPESNVPPEPRKVDLARWQRDISRHLQDFPRQYAALEHAMAAFGGDFDLQQFKAAYDTVDDMDAYNRVQALERAVGRVQNFVADLAHAGAKLAQLPHGEDERGAPAHQAFTALRDAAVIDGNLCRRLLRAQEARSMIEHSYVGAPAGNVHQAAELVLESARDFIARYRPWVEPYLRKGTEQKPQAE